METSIPSVIQGGKKYTEVVLSDQSINEIVDNLVNKVSECHFSKPQIAVCSPKNVVDKMKDYVIKKGRVIKDDDPPKIVNTIKELLDCHSESCVLKRKDFIEFAKINNFLDILNKNFKPEGPATNFGLLSNFNIDDVLDQFEQKFASRKFLHIPFQMRDFEKVGTQLATVDLAKKFREGYKTFGVVLNTDWSSGRGIHWYCITGGHKGNYIELVYFNSSGKPPLPETQAWLQKTKHHLEKELRLETHIYYSTGEMYQSDDHSCGVYCLAFIYLYLEGVPFQWFKRDKFNDSIMHKLRKNLFRWEI